jgi:hypothetical protein
VSAENIIASLKKLRNTGPGKWVACCPAHEDKSPSMAISDQPDGRVLIHCFAGCTPIAILEALGLSVDELFPTTESHKNARKPVKISPMDALICIEAEARIVYTLAANIAYKGDLAQEDRERGQIAALRIISALKHCLR